jgi:hypothetical protein
VAHHQSFLRVQESAELLQWLERGLSIYSSYIANYSVDSETLESEITLKKSPMVRINQLYKFCSTLGIPAASLTVEYKQLVTKAKDRIEEMNKKVDLNTISFDQVKDLHTMGTTVAYFKIEDVIKRDYFQFTLTHPLKSYKDILAEVFLLKNNTIAITQVLNVGRTLMFPMLNVVELQLEQNDTDAIMLSTDEIQLYFTCPDDSQMEDWNNVLEEIPLISSFEGRYHKLSCLKNDKVGLGLQVDSQLRKSSLMISRHDSLLRSSILSDSSLKLNLEQYFNQDADLHKLNASTDMKSSPIITSKTPKLKQQETPNLQTSDLQDYYAAIEASFSPAPVRPSLKKSLVRNNLNESVVSLPISQSLNTTEGSSASYTSISTKPFASTTDLSSTATETKKKRKSIFNIFAKKEEEPSFEIVTKPIVPVRESSPKPSSMASLHRSMNKLSLKPELPSPFVSKTMELTSLSSTEQKFLNESVLCSTITNSCLVSTWNNNKWEQLGRDYQTELRFFSHVDDNTLAIYTHGQTTPARLIPLINATLTKPSARDLQLRCSQSITDQRMVIFTIRCIDSRTVSLVLDEFKRAQGQTETLSTASSSSTIFDKPSNSTSMSSLDDFRPPKVMYAQKSSSTFSLGSHETRDFGVSELLLLTKKVRLHQLDEDGDWIPVSMAKLSLFSNVTNPEYSKFKVACNSGMQLDVLVTNKLCQRLGRSGLQFIHDNEGDELSYLLEFKDGKECEEVYELLM